MTTNTTAPNLEHIFLIILVTVAMLIEHNGSAVVLAKEELGMSTTDMEGYKGRVFEDAFNLSLLPILRMNNFFVVAVDCKHRSMPGQPESEYREYVAVGGFVLMAEPVQRAV